MQAPIQILLKYFYKAFKEDNIIYSLYKIFEEQKKLEMFHPQLFD